MVHKKSGWLDLADTLAGGFLDQEEQEYLEYLDGLFMANDATVNRILAVHNKALIPDDIEEPDLKIKHLSEKIEQAYKDYQKNVSDGGDIADRMVIMSFRRVSEMEKLRKQLIMKHNCCNSVKYAGKIDEADLLRARGFPLENLIPDLPKNGMISCPAHEDKKPSLLVKNGFGYCFSCNEWYDSIKWLIVVEKRGFLDAVNRLN